MLQRQQQDESQRPGGSASEGGQLEPGPAPQRGPSWGQRARGDGRAFRTPRQLPGRMKDDTCPSPREAVHLSEPAKLSHVNYVCHSSQPRPGHVHGMSCFIHTWCTRQDRRVISAGLLERLWFPVSGSASLSGHHQRHRPWQLEKLNR